MPSLENGREGWGYGPKKDLPPNLQDLKAFPRVFDIGEPTKTKGQIKLWMGRNTITAEAPEAVMVPHPLLTVEEAPCITDSMRKVLNGMGISRPTSIQSMAWPVVLSGHDCIGLAETGVPFLFFADGALLMRG